MEEESKTKEFPDVDIGIDVFNPEKKEEIQKEIMKKHEEFPELGIGFDFFEPVKVIGKQMEEKEVLGSVLQEAREETENLERENNKNKNKKEKEDLDEGEDIKEIIKATTGKDEENIDLEEKDENILDIF